MTNEQCSLCKFWATDCECETSEGGGTESVCMRYPPILRSGTIKNGYETASAFTQPWVLDEGWCGEYKPTAT